MIKETRKRKRPNHNELERRRRFKQKQQFLELQSRIPCLCNERCSTVMIVTKACEYIDELKSMLPNNDKLELPPVRDIHNDEEIPTLESVLLTMNLK